MYYQRELDLGIIGHPIPNDQAWSLDHGTRQPRD